MNQLFAANSIEQQRHSGYRSTVHAIAELVDNSIDANAKNITILLVEENVRVNNQQRDRLTSISVIDDGKGMKPELLNKCLTFADGQGTSNGRIGKFGYGLPNSTVAVCRRGEVSSQTKNTSWHHVYIDIDEIVNSGEAKYASCKPITNLPKLHPSVNLPSTGTIVTWSRLDKCDAAQASTLEDRIQNLLGRIYRYYLENGVTIKIVCAKEGNRTSTKTSILEPSDPLFLTTRKCAWTEQIWAIALDKTGQYQNPDNRLPEDPLFNASFHYAQLIEGFERGEGQHPLFQPCPGYFNNRFQVNLGDQTVSYTIKATFAVKQITNPGRRSGGQVGVGLKHIRDKMEGTHQCPSANIFFIRSNREIDYGSFGLYTVTENKNRFWTIEIHFTSELDELLGVSNTKQSVEFKGRPTGLSDEIIDVRGSLTIGEKREYLWSHISKSIKACQKKMTGYHREYASEYKELENKHIRGNSNQNKPIPEPEGRVIRALPRGTEWNDNQIQLVTEYIREFYPAIPEDALMEQITTAARGLTSTLVLYAPNETGNLFDIEDVAGKSVTIFNTRHPYYEKVIQPLKGEPRLGIFTVVIEMLISSFALKKESLVNDYPDMLHNLDAFVEGASSQLKTFINRGGVEVVTEDFSKHFNDEENDTQGIT